jgi:NitT/TauT family transport system permease protein
LDGLIPWTGLAGALLLWQVAILASSGNMLPGPWQVAKGIVELAEKGLLLRYLVASLFRVTWGYATAVLLAIPLGLWLGWYRRAERTFNPFIQILRPISPLAWIPIAILWFGIGDQPAIFIIFLGSFFPMTVAVMNAVRNIPAIHIQVGRNFGLSTFQILRLIVYPAVMPQLIVGMRLALGIAWLVVVAAEMIAVNSGLGFLIVESRNAGDRYDLVVAGMVLIGIVGLGLDTAMLRLERVKSLRWNYAANAPTDSMGHVERRLHAR